MISLPDVTLVIPTTRAHELARITANDLVSKVAFGDVLIYTDDCERIAVPGARYVKVDDWPTKDASSLFYYTEAALGITTSHALLLEWDAGACNPAMWRDEFLQYDYIGAPWHSNMCMRTPDLTVGNGGFALVTKRMIEFCHAKQFPIYSDMNISRRYRREIENGGFKWAPENVALDFAYEGWTAHGPVIPKTPPSSFGYHCVTNWPAILTRDDLIARAKILSNGTHGREKVRLLVRAAPWIEQELNLHMPDYYTHVYNDKDRRRRLQAVRDFDIQNRRCLLAASKLRRDGVA
jgi:hypothetical protein